MTSLPSSDGTPRTTAPGWADLVDQYDQARRSDAPPPLEEVFARAGGLVPADRRKLLEELVKIDLECSWRQRPKTGAGQPALLEDYARRFADLRPLERLPLDLIGEEYRVRKLWGDRPRHEDYLARFPAHVAGLRPLLAQVDTALAAEFATAADRPGAPPQAALFEADSAPLFHSVVVRPVMPTVAELVHALRSGLLLDPARQAELPALQGRCADTRALAGELLRRNWLTAFQVNQLLLGRDSDLTLGPYVLLERLGEGGAGQVFKARHQKMNRIVALKLLRKELLSDAEVVGRFYREIQIVSQLDHPNVVRAYDAGPAGATHFLAMEYVEGTDLGRLVKQGGRLPVEQACEYIRQAACGLAHAHERGLVHRDIKPHNLIMSIREGLVKLTDLGLARLPRALDREASAVLSGGVNSSGTLTPENAAFIGTADYMSPEQALDFRAADIRSDIYGLGCTFYFLLTGRPPFPGSTMAERLLKHQQAQPAPVGQFRVDVPAGVAAVLDKMLRKRPKDRYQTPGDVAAALEPFCRPASAAGSLGRPAGQPPPLGPATWTRRRLWRASGAALALLGGLLLLGWLVFGPSDRHLSPAARALKRLKADAKNPHDLDQLRNDIGKLRMDFAGTPEDQEAARLFTQLKSPLDKLDHDKIPAALKSPDQPKELVAVMKRMGQPGMRCVAFSPDCRFLAHGGDDKSVHLYDPVNGNDRELKGHATGVMAVAWSPNGRTVASLGNDGIIKLWEAATQSHLGDLVGEPTWPRGLAFSPDGATLASPSGGGVQLWDVARRKVRLTLKPAGRAFCLAFSPDGQFLAIGAGTGAVEIWDTTTGTQKIPVLPDAANTATYSIALAADGRTLAVARGDGLHLWDVATKTDRPTSRKPLGGTLDWPVAYDPAGRLLSADLTSFEILDAAGKATSTWKLPWTTDAIAVAADGRHLALMGREAIFILRLPAPK
jgi:serine/threonine-protein kinase